MQFAENLSYNVDFIRKYEIVCGKNWRILLNKNL